VVVAGSTQGEAREHCAGWSTYSGVYNWRERGDESQQRSPQGLRGQTAGRGEATPRQVGEGTYATVHAHMVDFGEKTLEAGILAV
jgi:hypothetical protein